MGKIKDLLISTDPRDVEIRRNLKRINHAKDIGSDIDGFADAIRQALEEYSEEVEEKIDNGIDEISDALVNQLENDPVIPERTGEYKKSFYVKTVAKGKGFKRNVVANKKHQLTHLLEYPHATRGGKGRSKAYPHWQTAQDKLDELTEELKNKL